MTGCEEHWILVIENDPAVRVDVLVPGLRAAGFKVAGARGAGAARRCMHARRFSLFVLDAGLADEEGAPLTRHLRNLTDAGIVALVGNKASKRDGIRTLAQGADTWLTKPVDIDILVATARNLLRRLQNTTFAAADWNGMSRWRIEAHGWNLAMPGGKTLRLAQAERLLLEVLAASPGRVVPREAVLSRLSDAMLDFDPRRLANLVARLRRKVAALTGERLPLSAVRGTGYVLYADLLLHRGGQHHGAHRAAREEMAGK